MAQRFWKITLLLAVVGLFTPARAMPPFVYASALTWLRDTVHSEIPENERIYILGPDRTKEFYGSNGGLSTHDLETRIVVSAPRYKTLTDLLADLPFKDRKIYVVVWRAGHQKDHADWPVYRDSLGNALSARYTLQADDIVELKPVPTPGAVTI